MKVDIHDLNLQWAISGTFLRSVKQFAKHLYQKDKTLRSIQFYSSFCGFYDEYPFVEDATVFYPAALWDQLGKWRTQWICFPKQNALASNSLTDLFHAEKPISISVCEQVPTRFSDQIKNKIVYFAQHPIYATGYVDFSHASREKILSINLNFADELSRQISAQLVALTGCVLSPNWSLCISAEPDMRHTVEQDGLSYNCVELSLPNAGAIQLGVCWPSDIDLKESPEQGITFTLTEKKFYKKIASFREIKKFIKDGGFPLEPLRLPSPDSLLLLHLRTNVTSDLKNRILEIMADCVEKWNDTHREEEYVCDFFPVEELTDIDVDEKSIAVYMDCGMSSSSMVMLYNAIYHALETNVPEFKNYTFS